MRRSRCRMSGRGQGTRSNTTSRSARPGTSTPSRIASVPSRQLASSVRNTSTSVALSIASTCCASSGMPGRLQRRRDARVHRLQPRDRGEQPERAAARGQEQRAIGAGQRGQVARRHVGHDEGAGLRRVVERARHRDADRRGGQMRRADARLRRRPGRLRIVLAGIAQRGRGDQQPVRRLRQRGGERHRRVEPVPVQPDIARPARRRADRAAGTARAVGRVARLGGGSADGAQHRLPRGQRVERAAAQRAADRLDAVAHRPRPGPRPRRRAGRPGARPGCASGAARRASARPRPRGGLGQFGQHGMEVAFQAERAGRRGRRPGARQHLPAQQAQERLGRVRPARLDAGQFRPVRRPAASPSPTPAARAPPATRRRAAPPAPAARRPVPPAAAAARARAIARPPRPAASGAAPPPRRPTVRRRRRRRRRRTGDGPRRTRSAAAPWRRRCRPRPPAPSPARGWRPPDRRRGRGGWCARRSSAGNAGRRRGCTRRAGRPARRAAPAPNSSANQPGRSPPCRSPSAVASSPARDQAERHRRRRRPKPPTALFTASSKFSRQR